MSIALMTCFARSGGTVLNRCLGCLPDVVILSELHHLGGGTGRDGEALRTVHDQAWEWYGIELRHDEFIEALCELHDICKRQGKRLVLRDWVSADFIPHRFNGYEPGGRLTTLPALGERLDVRPFAFVRDGIDVWISRRCPDPVEFFAQYRRYAEAIVESGMPIFRYEDFCRKPEPTMRRICEAGDLPYSDAFRDYESFAKVNGDVQLGRPSRGVRQGEIAPLTRRAIAPGLIDAVDRCPAMVEANRLLGYPTQYEPRRWKRWLNEGRCLVDRLVYPRPNERQPA